MDDSRVYLTWTQFNVLNQRLVNTILDRGNNVCNLLFPFAGYMNRSLAPLDEATHQQMLTIDTLTGELNNLRRFQDLTDVNLELTVQVSFVFVYFIVYLSCNKVNNLEANLEATTVQSCIVCLTYNAEYASIDIVVTDIYKHAFNKVRTSVPRVALPPSFYL